MNRSSLAPKRRLFRLPRWLLVSGIFVSSLPTFAVVLAFPVANLWMDSRWNTLRAEWEEQGEILELEALVAPSLPDGDNFARTALISECYQTAPILRNADSHHHHHHIDASASRSRLAELDLFATRALVPPQPAPAPAFLTGHPLDLGAFLPATTSANDSSPVERMREIFRPSEPLITELLEAADCSGASYPIDLSRPSQTILAHLPPLIQALHVLRVHNLLQIESGPESAAQGERQLCSTLRLIRLGTESKGLASHSVRLMALEAGGLEVVWQALLRHRFDDAQWARIDQELRAYEFGPRLMEALRFERAALIREVENNFDRRSARPFSVPPAWVRLSGLIDYTALTQKYWFTDGITGNLLTEGPRLAQLAAIERQVSGLETTFASMVTITGVLPVHDLEVRSRWIETQRNHALVAIALERHRLAHGRFPDRLGELVPEFLPSLSGQPGQTDPPRYDLLPAPENSGPSIDGYRLRSFVEGAAESDPLWVMPSQVLR